MAIAHSGEAHTGRGVLVIAWVFLLLAAVVWGISNQHLDIETRSSQALAGAEIEGIVSVDGRDVTIAGVPAGSQADVAELIRSIEGVRSVAVVESPVAAAPLPTTAPAPRVPSTVSPPPSTEPTARITRPRTTRSRGRPPGTCLTSVLVTSKHGSIMKSGTS